MVLYNKAGPTTTDGVNVLRQSHRKRFTFLSSCPWNIIAALLSTSSPPENLRLMPSVWQESGSSNTGFIEPNRPRFPADPDNSSSNLTEQKHLIWLSEPDQYQGWVLGGIIYLFRFRLNLYRSPQSCWRRSMSFWMWTFPSIEVLLRTFPPWTSICCSWISFSGNSPRSLWGERRSIHKRSEFRFSLCRIICTIWRLLPWKWCQYIGIWYKNIQFPILINSIAKIKTCILSINFLCIQLMKIHN